MKLVPDAALAWRFNTVRAAALLVIFSMLQADLLPLLQPLVPAERWPWVSLAFGVAVIVLRVFSQPGLEPEREQLQLRQAQPSQAPRAAFDPQGQDVDGLVGGQVEGMAVTLYEAASMHKPWAQVSPASQERWRTLAAAALARNQPRPAAPAAQPPQAAA